MDANNTQLYGALAGLIGLDPGAKLAVTGCGGKTSVVGLLARENRRQKVLVMSTTKIWPMDPREVRLITSLKEALAHRPAPGIQCIGVMQPDTGKYTAPPPEYWPRLTEGYDLVLMEADGSAGLPCKGWREGEPVVPDFATCTAGVVTLNGLGKPATAEYVLRLPLFLQLCGLNQGDTIGMEHLAAMCAAPNGMFRRWAGRRCLIINAVEDENSQTQAKALAEIIEKRYPFVIDRFIVGSAMQNRWTPV